MSTFSPGLSDSIGGGAGEPKRCPHCDSFTQIAGGLCVGCLLESGLAASDACDPEELQALLTEVKVPDQNWRLGNYEILEEIGRGGMGVIYRARQRHSRRLVAVKRVLSYHADSRQTLARFQREAQAAASLDHPNILPIYEVSQSEDGLPFFSMKFATGGTLQQVAPALRDDPRRCVALVAKVARAVHHAHTHGILHRDLKPGNVLLDGRGEPLVSDFGLVKWLDAASDLTGTLTVFGTPGYIAPEQATSAAAELKATADIYSLGAVLFDLLAGRPPFLGTHALSVIHQASISDAPKLRSLSKLADRDLETICARCLEREPGARYQSAADLAVDLQRWLEGRPILARPVSAPMRIWRWSRRNPKLAVALGAVVVLAGFGLAQRIASGRLSSIVRAAEVARHSVAVTPIEDLDALSVATPDARGLTRFLTLGLSSGNDLRVVATPEKFLAETEFWTPQDWYAAASKMEARLVLAGSIRRRENKWRVTFRVIEGASGKIVRRQICEFAGASLEDKSLLATVAATLRALQAKTSSQQNSDNPEGAPTNSSALEYLRAGKEYYFRYTPSDTNTAIRYFEKAVSKDPKSAEAQAFLGLALARHFQHDPHGITAEKNARAWAAATEAVRLDPQLAIGYRAQAALLSSNDVAGSLEAALCAFELEPENSISAGLVGNAWRLSGRPDLAIPWLQRSGRGQRPAMNAANIADALTALGEDEAAEKAYKEHIQFWPDLPDSSVGLARLAMYRRDFARAREQADAALERFPDHGYARQMRAIVQLFARDFASAEINYRQLAEDDRKGGAAFYCAVSNLSALSYLRFQAGDAPAARTLANEAAANAKKELSVSPKNHDTLYDLAAIEALLGNGDEAYSNLAAALANGWIDYRSLALDPRFDSLRGDERFQSIIDRLSERMALLRKKRARKD
jgi:TolB-like protein/tRNA A-37 threonylcarbamoyl transferase component Bud32